MNHAPDRYVAALDRFIGRLVSNASVDGVVLMGSTAFGPVRPWSDYDVFVVFDRRPAALRLVSTWIDGRIAEVYCTEIAELDRIVSANVHVDAGEAGMVVRWLRKGRIAFDRSGRLGVAREAARRIAIGPPTDTAAHDAWRSIGYNVAQMRRYTLSSDQATELVLAMRLTYSLADVMTAYFAARRLPWQGEKAAVAYWQASDPAFLRLLSAALAETDTREKVERYIEAAGAAVAPVGPLWADGVTMLGLGDAFGSGNAPPADHALADAAAAWDALIEDW